MSLWEFASRVYGNPIIAETSLALQEAFDLDVCVLLFAGWMAFEHGPELSEMEVAEVATSVALWNERIVQPLRAVRTELKSGPPPANNDTAALRDQVKRTELLAERIELAMLERVGCDRFGGSSDRPTSEALGLNIVRVVDHYSGRPADSALRARLSVFCDALARAGSA